MKNKSSVGWAVREARTVRCWTLAAALSVASLCSALGATTTKRNVQFTSDLALPLLYDVVYDVDETGAKIISPKTVPKPEPPSLPFLIQGSFLGYFGKFRTTDSGEEEVELKVYDENGNAVESLPGVVLPPAPEEFYAKWAPEEDPKPPKEDTWDGTEPILYFIESFMPGNSNEKIAEYTDRISKDSENYEAYIGRGFTWLTSLSESNATLLVMEKFGFGFDDRNGMISRIPVLSNFDFGEKLQNEPKIDEACAIAIPALKNAIADFAMVPEDWAGAMDFTYQPDMKYPADVTVSFGYADTLLARALCCEMISALYLMKGYNTVCADGTTKKDIDLGALKEAQRWMRNAAEMVNAFVPAEANRPDPSRNYFFNLRIPADEFLRQNAQNLLDVPYWTVRFDFSLFPELLFLNGEETAAKREKRNALRDYIEFDMTLRNVFEGKLSREAGTFPVLKLGFQNLDESVTDPTFAGTFPGISRTALAGFLWPLEEDKVLKTLPDNPNEKIAHYGVVYRLPEGAENNPDNPATFSSDLEHEIRLKNPTMEGYDFLGWTHNGVIPAGNIPVGAVETLELSGRFAKITPEGEEKQGTSDNPWEIGQSNAADVKAWMDDAGKLTIAGEGRMKDFTLIEAPWYSVRDSTTALEIGSGVTTLGELAFNNCRGLTRVTIPSSVGTIGERAFYGCPLSRVIAMKERPSWPLDEAFGPPSQFKGVVLVPAPVVDKYKAAFGWDKYADFIWPIVDVALGESVVCDTAEDASNKMAQAVLTPSAAVAAVLTTDTALATYRDMFTFDVVPTSDDKWTVEAVLTPKAESNLVENASAATRQIPVSDIAAMTEEGKKVVTVEGCVPGFYYTLYGAAGVRAIPMGGALPTMEATAYGPVLCEPDKPVTFEAVEKPSETAGFFSIEARAVREW